jgi:hypothetical protein
MEEIEKIVAYGWTQCITEVTSSSLEAAKCLNIGDTSTIFTSTIITTYLQRARLETPLTQQISKDPFFYSNNDYHK